MSNVTVQYPDGTASTYQTGDIQEFIKSTLGGEATVLAKELTVIVDGEAIVFQKPVVVDVPKDEPKTIEPVKKPTKKAVS